MESLVIFGNPGCGKTRYLVETAFREADAGFRVTFVSFTRAAAAEALSRLPEAQKTRIFPSTLHSLAFATLGLSSKQVIDRRKLTEIAAATGVHFRRWPEEDPLEGDEYIQVISLAKNRMIPYEAAYEMAGRPGKPPQFAMFHRAYDEWKAVYGFHDFDDMLLRILKLPAERIGAHPVLMLDEAQDCSVLQWAALDRFIEKTERVYVCGDPDQAIFEWSGADPHGMTNFGAKYESGTTELAQSYRCPRLVWAKAMAILEEITNRVPKTFEPRDAAGTVNWASEIQRVDIVGMEPQGALILVRDRFHMLEAQRWLNSLRIPHQINGGTSLYTNVWANAIRGIKHIRDGDPVSKDEKRALADKAPDMAEYDIKMSTRPWHKILDLPEYLRDFYMDTDIDVELRVTLSTVHQAKGHEHQNVVVDVNMTDRVYNEAQLNTDAECRVWYVAVTRSAENLTLCGSNFLL